jgi:hypothetical protein
MPTLAAVAAGGGALAIPVDVGRADEMATLLMGLPEWHGVRATY